MGMPSTVQWERIQAAAISREETEKRVETLKGQFTEAKKLREERQESLFAGMKAAREGSDDKKGIDAETSKSLFKLEADYERAVNSFELVDREKRRTEDTAKKLTERVLRLLKEARDGPDLYNQADADSKPDPLAWRKVMLSDLVEELVAKPFQEQNIFSVGDFIKAWDQSDLERLVKAKDLPKKAVAYMAAKLVEYLKSRGVDVPKSLADVPAAARLDDAVPAEAPKGVKEPKKGKEAKEEGAKAIVDHEGKEKPTHIMSGTGKGDLPDFAHKTWWAIWHELSDKDRQSIPLAKIGPAISELDNAGWSTPYLYLTKMRAMFKRFPDRAEAMDAIPAMPDVLEEILMEGVAETGRNSADMRALLVELAAANLDAFLNYAGGKDSPWNTLRLQAERQDEKPKPAKGGPLKGTAVDPSGKKKKPKG